MSDQAAMLLPHFMGVQLGDESDAAETIAQIEPLLLDGETVEFATRGESGGAAFTNLRLMIVNDAGLFTKRSVISFIRTASIDAVSIDADTLFQVKLTGRGFGGAHLFFGTDVDKLKVTRWFSSAVTQS